MYTATVADPATTQLEPEKVFVSTPGASLRILVATDGSHDAGAANRLLHQLPLPAGSEVRLTYVIPGAEYEYAEWAIAAQRTHAKRLLKDASHLVPATAEVSAAVRWGAAAAEIIEAAREWKADLILLGTHGRTGLEGFLLGSVARNVAHHAGRPVLVARRPQGPIRRVVLGVDDSEHAQQALRFLTRLPLDEQAEVTVCAVIQHPGLLLLDGTETAPEYWKLVAEAEQFAQQQAEQLADHSRNLLTEAGLRTNAVVRDGDPAGQILQLARENEADLVVAGARGSSVRKRLGRGSVSDRLLKHAPCSVLLVDQGE